VTTLHLLRVQDNFGSEVPERLELIVMWKQENNKKKKAKQCHNAFLAVIAGEYDHPYHQINYPTQKANATLGTAATAKDEHNMNLATLATDLGCLGSCSDSGSAGAMTTVYHAAWVKRDFARLPFIVNELREHCQWRSLIESATDLNPPKRKRQKRSVQEQLQEY
jgi:hypothetical protein